MNKADYIHQLDLAPHPEGGWFKRTYASEETYFAEESNGQRHRYTAIYFLLDDTSPSHFHRLNHDELWFYHDGVPITIHCIAPSGKYYSVKLGLNLANDEQPQFCVPKNTIFASEVQDKNQFCLVSCVVSPGFDFNDFELMHQKDLQNQYPTLDHFLIERLTLD